MGLFDRLFGHLRKPRGDYGGVFKMLTGYSPAYTSFGGSIYESELVRASINAIATHAMHRMNGRHGDSSFTAC